MRSANRLPSEYTDKECVLPTHSLRGTRIKKTCQHTSFGVYINNTEVFRYLVTNLQTKNLAPPRRTISDTARVRNGRSFMHRASECRAGPRKQRQREGEKFGIITTPATEKERTMRGKGQGLRVGHSLRKYGVCWRSPCVLECGDEHGDVQTN
jgi:hypothetical protein